MQDNEQQFPMLREHIFAVNAAGELVGGVDAWCDLIGCDAAVVASRGWLDAVDRRDRDAVASVWSAERRAPFGAEIRLRQADGETRWVALRLVPAAEHPRHEWLGIISDIDPAKRHEQATAFLLQLSELFASKADERAILRKLAGIAVPAFTDWCTVHLLRSDGTIENVAATGADDAHGEIARQLERFSKLASDAPLRGALQTGRVQLQANVTDAFLSEHVAVDKADGEFLRRLGVRSLIVAPILIRDAVVGAIRFLTTNSERRYRADDALLAEDVARRASLAIDNARSRAEAVTSGHSRDLFLAMLSHEMKTPLTSILGWTRMLRADGPGSELFIEALQAIEQSANVQQRLIDDLLDVSRVIAGKLHLEFAALDVRRLLDGAVEMLAPRAKENGQHIRVTASEPLTVYGDETRLRQVLWNLLSNAMKYTPSGGLIELTAAPGDDEVMISVRDTGRGIRPEVLPYVFDRFHQATVADRAKHGGLGLGLAIVRNIVELHSGRVEASSAGEGKGSTFSVHLPLHRGPTEIEGEKP